MEIPEGGEEGYNKHPTPPLRKGALHGEARDVFWNNTIYKNFNFVI